MAWRLREQLVGIHSVCYSVGMLINWQFHSEKAEMCWVVSVANQWPGLIKLSRVTSSPYDQGSFKVYTSFSRAQSSSFGIRIVFTSLGILLFAIFVAVLCTTRNVLFSPKGEPDFSKWTMMRWKPDHSSRAKASLTLFSAFRQTPHLSNHVNGTKTALELTDDHQEA